MNLPIVLNPDGLLGRLQEDDAFSEIRSAKDQAWVHNASGAVLPQYKVASPIGVYSVEGSPTVVAVSAEDQVLAGVAVTDIPNNFSGYLLRRGLLQITGLDTTPFPLGAPVYCTTAGDITMTATQYKVGASVTQNANGTVYFSFTEVASLWDSGTFTLPAYNIPGYASHEVNIPLSRSDFTHGVLTLGIPSTAVATCEFRGATVWFTKSVSEAYSTSTNVNVTGWTSYSGIAYSVWDWRTEYRFYADTSNLSSTSMGSNAFGPLLKSVRIDGANLEIIFNNTSGAYRLVEFNGAYRIRRLVG